MGCHPSSVRWVRFGLILSVGLICLMLPSLLVILGANYDYGVVIDAGSSGSRVHIYMWEHRANSSTHPHVTEAPEFAEPKWSLKVEPGLSAFAANPQQAYESVQVLLDYARSVIPGSKVARTPVFLFATAGMRILEERNPAGSEAVLNAARSAVAQSGFLCPDTQEQVRIITGQEEAVFGWVTVNYALGLLGTGRDPMQTVGALDLGGASTQIAFVPSEQPYRGEGAANLTLLGVEYHIYAQSFLGYGVDQARYRLNMSVPEQGSELLDPCVQTGFTESIGQRTLVGTGNADSCAEMMPAVLNITTPGTRLANSTIPPIRGKFYAFSAYAYTAEFFGFGVDVSASMYATAAQWFCALPWAEVLEQFTYSPFLSTYCFQASYENALLTHGLGFDSLTNVSAVAEVANIEAGWTLGAMTYEAGLLPWVPAPLDPPAGTRFVLMPGGIVVTVVGALLVIISLLVLCCSRQWKLPPVSKHYVTV